MNFSLCEKKALLKTLLKKIDENTLSDFEELALDNLCLELNQTGVSIDNYLSNKEFMDLFWRVYLISTSHTK
jgi:hypothetical protein